MKSDLTKTGAIVSAVIAIAELGYTIATVAVKGIRQAVKKGKISRLRNRRSDDFK